MDTQERKRKHEVQARKSSDGTFEIYLGEDEGLHEISEEEVSYVESVEPPETPREKREFPISPKVMAIGIASLLVVALLAIGISMWPASDDEEELSFVAGELPAVKGFKPYGGSGGVKKAKTRRLTKKSKAKKPKTKAKTTGDVDQDDVAKKVAVVDEEVIEGDEAKPEGWDVKDAVASTKEEGVIDETNDDSAEVVEEDTSSSRAIRSLKPGFTKPKLGNPNQLNRLAKPNLDVVRGMQDIRENDDESVGTDE